MKKIRSLQKRFLDSLQIPVDLSCQDSLVTCSGCSEIVVENYRKIVEFHDGKNTERLLEMLREDELLG